MKEEYEKYRESLAEYIRIVKKPDLHVLDLSVCTHKKRECEYGS